MKKVFLSYEKTLIFMGNATLVLGVMTAVILAFTTIYAPKEVYMSGQYYNLGKEFNPMGLAYTIATFIGSIATWAIFLSIAHASENIRNIRFNSLPNGTMAKNVSETEDKKFGSNLIFGIGITVFAGVMLYLILS